MQLNLIAPADIRQPEDLECREIRIKQMSTEARSARDVRELMRRETAAMQNGGYRYWKCRDVFSDRLKSDAPKVLFVKGIPDLASRKVAIVGPRRPDDYGVEMTKLFASALTESGLVIVSGGASGVDTLAHEAALDAGGRTICVLGSGFDRPHPQTNSDLFRSLGDPDGHPDSCLVSEYPPDMSAQAGFFPRRNRIVAALPDAVIVIQAAEGSGALITAAIAIGIGVPVFTIPADIAYSTSCASNELLGRGALAITKPADLLAVTALQSVRFSKRWPTAVHRQPGCRLPWRTGQSGARRDSADAPSDAIRLLEIIREYYLENGNGPDFDLLCRRTGKGAGLVQSALLTLELRGAVFRLPGGIIVPADAAE